MKLRPVTPVEGVVTPARVLRVAAVMCALCGLVAPVSAQPKPKKPPADAPATPDKSAGEKAGDKLGAGAKVKGDKVKTFDFTGIDLSGRMRTPQLLYFLERANEELERASLEKRSFIPHMVRSVEEEQL